MTTDQHYKLIDQTTVAPDGSVLYRIRALRDLPHHGVRAGDLGGYVAGTHNLSDNGWVSDRGQVYGNGQVTGNGRVSDRGQVTGNGWVSDCGQVSDRGQVYGNK